MYRKAETSFAKTQNKLYSQNILSAMEEVYYNGKDRIDIVIFLNGLAIFAIELKCNSAGQNVNIAIKEYKEKRDPKTSTFAFKTGVLAAFAIDTEEVYMCTRLTGDSSSFLPFNKGNGKGIDSGKGNPYNPNGISVSYMWEDIFTKESILYIIDNFILVQGEKIIFPRYHQLNAVRSLSSDIRENKTKRNYLIQHSTGSGKTNTIAWLAHRLASLHDKNENAIFKTIVIISDRIIIDDQLQEAVLAIEHKEGLVKVIEDKSKDLADALNGNTKIIVSTIHKFGNILDIVENLAQKTFAIIIDEAHSSTAGLMISNVNEALSKNSEADEEELIEDRISKEINARKKQPNVSMIAFTATPKDTTLQLFGAHFDNYSMKQAIEEEFILDVLKNYTTYRTYCEINKAISDDPELKTRIAKRKIMNYINLHDKNIGQNIEIIAEHFCSNIMHLLDGKAKAMVVTSSRKAAIKYKLAFDEYVQKNHSDKKIKSLVAFTGEVSIDGKEFKEEKMNGFSSDPKIFRKEFDRDEYQILFVANKCQTGFDQPKLCAMYIDKKLNGVNAVQTLSRLNRIYPNKNTFIIDFKNTYDDINKSFAPYYIWTEADHIELSDFRNAAAKINLYGFLHYDDINAFNKYLYQKERSSADKEKMLSFLSKSWHLINEQSESEQSKIKITIKEFLKFYNFIIQATSFYDIDLHKKFNFLSYLVKGIDGTSNGNDFDIADKITVTYHRPQKTGEFNDPLIFAEPKIDHNAFGKTSAKYEEYKKLSEIIEEINKLRNKNFDIDDTAKAVLRIKEILLKDEQLKSSAKSNDKISDFEFSYDKKVNKILLDGYEQNKDFYGLLLNDKELGKRIMHVFIEDVYRSLRG
jgi:type I restriction enzyme R subunit